MRGNGRRHFRLPAFAKNATPEKEISCSSLRWNDIEFYFHFVFDLNSSACDAYGSYAEGGLLERGGAAVVAIL